MEKLNIKALENLNWFLVIVNSRSEKKVATLLRTRGLEVFLPLQTRARQWSDRVKLVEFPLFACNLFCRCEPKDCLSLIHTPGVCGKPIPVPEVEIDCLMRVIDTPYSLKACNIPAGSYPNVALKVDQSIQAKMVIEGAESGLVVCLRTIGQAVALKVPFEELIPLSDVSDVPGEAIRREF